MSKKYNRSLFIFRRDLRLQDNTALNAALNSSKEVIAAFFFDPRQVEDHAYKSIPGLQYLCESLEYLDQCLRKRDSQLFCWQAVVEDKLGEVIKDFDFDAVFFNHDYTPFSTKRDKAIEKVCTQNGVECCMHHDLLLNVPGSVQKSAGGPYSVFTPFYKKANQNKVAKPEKLASSNFFKKQVKDLSFEKNKPIYEDIESIFINGGRKKALTLLNAIEDIKDYSEQRNLPAIKGTSGLSACLKFGTVSVREVFYKALQVFGDDHVYRSELYWRDFFTHVAHHFPHVFKGCFHQKYDSLKWSKNKKHFEAWCKGQTGFPIVDAGMRELNITGFMHNRVRMITASFLVKDLHINWQEGEKYFATRLIDYDPAVNNGNWQWAASTGCDAQPYFRIFNPWRQIERFDPELKYIKKWVPELENATLKDIKNLEKGSAISGYKTPIVDHREQKEIASDMFADITGAASN